MPSNRSFNCNLSGRKNVTGKRDRALAIEYCCLDINAAYETLGLYRSRKIATVSKNVAHGIGIESVRGSETGSGKETSS